MFVIVTCQWCLSFYVPPTSQAKVLTLDETLDFHRNLATKNGIVSKV